MSYSPSIHHLIFIDCVGVHESSTHKTTSSPALHSFTMKDPHLNNLRMCALLGCACHGDMQVVIPCHVNYYLEGNRYLPIKYFLKTLQVRKDTALHALS